MTTLTAAGRRAAEPSKPRDAAGWLSLAASPTFGLMAWVSARGGQAMYCLPTPGDWPIDGMAWMYLLMGIFHLAPWLRLASALARRSDHSIREPKGD